jgi:hypothetical protein
MKILIVLLAFLLADSPVTRGANMYPITKRDKAFFEDMRKAILADDMNWLSTNLVTYPFDCGVGKSKIILRSKKDLRKHASRIFDAALKATVRNQSPDSLFKNWQGVMVGNGEIWFSELGDDKDGKTVWTYSIIAINVPNDLSKKDGTVAPGSARKRPRSSDDLR